MAKRIKWIANDEELCKLLAVDDSASKILNLVSCNKMSGMLVDLINELLDLGQLSDTASLIRFVNEQLKYIWGDELVYENLE